jgi:hypothetical protein
MRTPVFEEVQRLREQPWIWPALVTLTLAIFLPIGIGAHQQLVLGNPWGDRPMSDQGMIYFLLFISLCWGSAMFLLLSLTLYTKIDDQGIHVRLFPINPFWQRIPFDSISEVSFEKRFKLFDGGGIGHNRNIIKRQKSLKIWGGKHMAIRTTDGRRTLIGTQKLDELQWTMKKIITDSR